MARQFNGTTDFAAASVDLTAFNVITVSMWYNAADAGVNDACVFGFNNGTAGRFYWNARATGGTGWVWGMNAGAYETSILLSASCPTFSQWHNMMMVYNRTAPSIDVYADGVLIKNKIGGSVAGAFGNGTLVTGRYDTAGGQFMAHKESDVVIWGGVALGSSEAAGLTLGYSPTSYQPASIVGWWPMTGVASPEPNSYGPSGSMTLTGTTQTSGPFLPVDTVGPRFGPMKSRGVSW